MAQISLSEDSVVQAEREPLTQSSGMQVAATPNSEPVRGHSQFRTRTPPLSKAEEATLKNGS
jgi:hypothetical protein